MKPIKSRGRRGSTVVPNWRCEDPTLDPYAFRIAVWLASHADDYMAEHVTRNLIARCTKVSQAKTTDVLTTLADLGIIEVETIDVPQAEGGRRHVITFDFDVWETGGPRSPHDRGPVATRPGPGRQATASVQQEVDQETLTLSPDPADRSIGVTCPTCHARPGSPCRADKRWHSPRGHHASRVAHPITDDWWEYVKQSQGAAPSVAGGFKAVEAMVARLIQDGRHPSAIGPALAALEDAGRTLTLVSIRAQIDGRAPRRAGPDRRLGTEAVVFDDEGRVVGVRS